MTSKEQLLEFLEQVEQALDDGNAVFVDWLNKYLAKSGAKVTVPLPGPVPKMTLAESRRRAFKALDALKPYVDELPSDVSSLVFWRFGEYVSVHDESQLIELDALPSLDYGEEQWTTLVIKPTNDYMQAWRERLQQIRGILDVGLTRTVDDDGPVRGNAFHYKGKVFHDMNQKVWLLLDFLWKRADRTATFTELAAVVWCDHGRDVTEGMVRGVQERARKFFAANALPYHISVSAQTQNVHVKESID